MTADALREPKRCDRESFGLCFDPVAGSRLIKKRIAAREQARRDEFARRIDRLTAQKRVA